jgi:transcriptional regulator with XRE-family HTH domain
MNNPKMPNPSPDFVETVLERMRALGVTQEEMAISLRISQGHLSKILRGQVPVSRRVEVEMKKYLDVSPGSSIPRGKMAPQEVATLGTRIMQNMHSTLTDLQRLCDGISQLVGKR